MRNPSVALMTLFVLAIPASASESRVNAVDSIIAPVQELLRGPARITKMQDAPAEKSRFMGSIPVSITGYIQPSLDDSSASIGRPAWDANTLTMTVPHQCTSACDFDVFLREDGKEQSQPLEISGMPARIRDGDGQRSVRVFPTVLKRDNEVSIVFPDSLRKHIPDLDISMSTVEFRYAD